MGCRVAGRRQFGRQTRLPSTQTLFLLSNPEVLAEQSSEMSAIGVWGKALGRSLWCPAVTHRPHSAASSFPLGLGTQMPCRSDHQGDACSGNGARCVPTLAVDVCLVLLGRLERKGNTCFWGWPEKGSPFLTHFAPLLQSGPHASRGPQAFPVHARRAFLSSDSVVNRTGCSVQNNHGF